MLSPARISALRSKHNLISRQIEFEENRSSVNRGLVLNLKKERLVIKKTLDDVQRGFVPLRGDKKATV